MVCHDAHDFRGVERGCWSEPAFLIVRMLLFRRWGTGLERSRRLSSYWTSVTDAPIGSESHIVLGVGLELGGLTAERDIPILGAGGAGVPFMFRNSCEALQGSQSRQVPKVHVP